MTKKTISKAEQVTISIAQAAALVTLYQQLDTARINHVGYLFHLISQPLPGDPEGRDLYAILRADQPELLEFLGRQLAEWVDVSNALTARAQADADRISYGPPVPVESETVASDGHPTTH